MRRFLGALALLLLPAWALAAPSATTAAVTASALKISGAQAWASAAPSPPSASEVNSLIATLQNPKDRARLIEQLRLLLKAEKSSGLVSKSAAAKAVVTLSDRIARVSDDFLSVAAGLNQIPRVRSWLDQQASQPSRRALWIRVLGNLAMTIGVGYFGLYAVQFTLRRPRSALAGRNPRHALLRPPFLAVLVVMDLMPIAVFAAAAYITLGFVNPAATTRLVAAVWINAVVLVRLVLVGARLIFAAEAPQLRLIPMADATARSGERWLGRLAAVGIFGYFAIEVARLLGLPSSTIEGLVRLLGLVLTLLVMLLVYRSRRTVRNHIRGRGKASGPLFEVRGVVAKLWHIPVILYVFGLYAIWALDIREGFLMLLRGTLLSLLAVALGFAALRLVEHLFAEGLRLSGELRPQLPDTKSRFRRYVPALRAGTRWLIYLAVTLGVLQVWGLGGFSWLSEQPGRTVATTAVSVVLTIVIALALWETTNLVITSYLAEQDHRGHLRIRSARAKTLLSVARTATVVVLSVITTLYLLSQLGVNIAPLLAAAGVLGIAVGFGSQKLVQDVITGFFILVEDIFAVGDVIQVDSHSGLVEAVSIRSVRLRDLSGTVHTIPFSTISAVSNLTKDFSFYVFDMGVAYREDVDQVIEILRAVGIEMRTDQYFTHLILDDPEVFGVDAFGDSSVVIKGRIKTRPIKQWEVGREFNRRIKKRFDELGIEMPFPHRTVYFGVDKDGSAPPAHVRTDTSAVVAASPLEARATAPANDTPLATPKGPA